MTRAALPAASLAAAAMIAFQTAAKATRDALFLSSHDVTGLPTMMIASALVALALVIPTTRLLTRRGPGRVVPGAFGVSAGLLLVEWGLLGPLPSVAAVLVYLHYGALGAFLISGFWSTLNERLDPRTAKQLIGRIGAAGTVGGLAGGLAAERVAALLSVGAMLPLLAALHAACAWLLLRLAGPVRAPGAVPLDAVPSPSGLRTIQETPYLRILVALVLIATVCEGLVDYVFKARASAAFGRGEVLLRFFAAFYTGVGLVTVLAQAVASRVALQGLGLARTAALLPAGVFAGTAVALALPGLPSAAAARGVEMALRNSLYRASYELFFTPLQPTQKRPTKALVDVGVVRLGDIAGGGIVQVLLLLGAGSFALLLGVSLVLAAAAAAVALRLHRGYVQTLEGSLLAQGVVLDISEASDRTTRAVLLQTAAGTGLGPVRALSPEPPDAGFVERRRLDAAAARVIELRSGDAGRVRRALAGPLSVELVGHVVPLLAWDDVLPAALTALRGVAGQATGQLVDRLLDEDEEFAVRRRIPLVLGTVPTERAAAGLVGALKDARFEVRYRSGRALVRLRELVPDVSIDHARVLDAVLAEVAVDRGVWEGRRLLDRGEDDAWSPVMDELLRERASRSLEHVFTVLALVLPSQPLGIAFRGLHTDDAMLRGTALEWLESVLPDEVREKLWPFLESDRRRPPSGRPPDDVLADLFRSNQSIAANLRALREREGSGGSGSAG